MFNSIILVAIIVLSTKAETVQNYIALMEQKIDGLAKQALKQFSDFSTQCLRKSYNQCEGTSQLMCYKNFPSKSNCVDKGARMSLDSAIRLAPGTVSNDLTTEQTHVICATAKLQDYFKSLDEDRNGNYYKAYIGTSIGMFRSYPTIRRQQSEFKCKDYDPRLRDWYTHAITGNKNMVLMIDNSGSQAKKLDTMKIAAKNLVKTFITNDTIAVFAFNDVITHLSSDSIVKANSGIRDQTISNIDSLIAGNSSNYLKALQKAFEMLQPANQNQVLCCKYATTDVIFVLFTDQSSIDTQSQMNALKDYLNTKSAFKIQLFIYSFSETSNQFLQELACSFRGELNNIQNGVSQLLIRQQLQKIYALMGKDQNFSQASWSEIYDDAFGFGRMTTITKPIYYAEADYLIGVAGIDSPLAIWYTFDTIDSEQEIARRILTNNKGQYSIKVGDCNSRTSSTIKFPNILISSFHDPESTETSMCCGLTKGALTGIIVGIIVFLAIIIGIIVYCVRRKSKKPQPPSNDIIPQPYTPTIPRFESFSQGQINENQIIINRLPRPPPKFFQEFP